MSFSTFISIDPGASGASVVRSANGTVLRTFGFAGYASIESTIRAATSPAGPGEVCALIERVWASPVMGVSSAFSFGENYGLWVGALRASGIPTYCVTPQKWQKSLHIPAVGPARKAALCAAAKTMFPREKVTLKTSDALLISEYFHTTNQANLPPGDPIT